MSQFSLPRSPVSASVLLDQGVSRPGDVFVMDREPHHDGAETVLEMLNRREGFFAFRPADEEGVLLMSKVHTVSVSVDRQAPNADPARLSAARMLGIELVLVGGSTLGGGASVELPEHHARLLDYLNASDEPVFPMWTHATAHYGNRAHALDARRRRRRRPRSPGRHGRPPRSPPRRRSCRPSSRPPSTRRPSRRWAGCCASWSTPSRPTSTCAWASLRSSAPTVR